MRLSEVFNSKVDLSWKHEGSDYFATFSIADRKYDITAQSEEHGGFTFIRVDFSFMDKDGNPHHEAIGNNGDASKILGIVSNGIKDKFKGSDCVYFLAKRETCKTLEEFQSRMIIYKRLMQKMGVEMNLIRYHQSLPDVEVYALCKNTAVKAALKNMI